MLAGYMLRRLGGFHFPAFSEKACLNHRGIKEPCSLCITSCPSGALNNSSGKIVIDTERCDGCGVCASACPTPALSQEKPDYLEALAGFKGQKDCCLGCRDGARGKGLVLPCLGGIPWEFLAALSLQGEGRPILVETAGCSSCFRGKSLQFLFAAIRKARLFVERAGYPFSLQIVSGESPPDPGEDPGLSRREALFQMATIIRKEALGLLPASPGKGGGESLRRWLPQYPVKNRKALGPGELPFMNWQVQHQCQACGFCQGVCPRQAWSLRKEDGSAALHHSPWECTSCGLCASLCPRQALVSSLWEAIPPGGSMVKKVFPLQACRSCKSPGVPCGEGGLCLPCSKKEQIRTALTGQIRTAPVITKGLREGVQ